MVSPQSESDGPLLTTTELLDGYDSVLDVVILVHSQVEMDTPEDVALHAKAVAEFRLAQSRLQEARARLASTTETQG